MPTTFSMRPDTGVRAWVRRHPLAAFLIVGVGLALLVMSVAILAQFGVIPGRSLPRRVGLEMERVAAALSILVLFPAALLITALEGGRPALRELYAPMLRWARRHRLVGVRPARATHDHRAAGGGVRRLAASLLTVVLGIIPRKELSRSFRHELDERERKHAAMTEVQQEAYGSI